LSEKLIETETKMNSKNFLKVITSQVTADGGGKVAKISWQIAKIFR